MHDVDNIFL